MSGLPRVALGLVLLLVSGACQNEVGPPAIVWDAGILQDANGHIDHVFTLVSDRDRVITSVKKSCSCLTTNAGAFELEKGVPVEFPVMVGLSQVSGRFEQEVRLFSGEELAYRLQCVGVVQRSLQVSPGKVVLNDRAAAGRHSLVTVSGSEIDAVALDLEDARRDGLELEASIVGERGRGGTKVFKCSVAMRDASLSRQVESGIWIEASSRETGTKRIRVPIAFYPEEAGDGVQAFVRIGPEGGRLAVRQVGVETAECVVFQDLRGIRFVPGAGADGVLGWDLTADEGIQNGIYEGLYRIDGRQGSVMVCVSR